MADCKKLIIVLFIVLVILLMLFGAVWAAGINNKVKKELSNDSSLKKGLKYNEAYIWCLGHRSGADKREDKARR